MVGARRCRLYVGISCGLSAAYVMGQVRGVLRDNVADAALLVGFNPAELARERFICYFVCLFFFLFFSLFFIFYFFCIFCQISHILILGAAPIEGWAPHSALSVVRELVADAPRGRLWLVNPVVGPEAVTGGLLFCPPRFLALSYYFSWAQHEAHRLF